MPTGTQDGRKRQYLDFDGYFAAVEEQASPALHGHDVGPLRTRRGSVGHGRVLPPEARSSASARPWAPQLEPVVPVRKQAFVGGLV